MAVLIKNVSDEKWKAFKAEAARRGIRVGELLEVLIDEHIKGESNQEKWDRILNRAPTLTDEEAEAMTKAIEEDWPFEPVDF